MSGDTGQVKEKKMEETVNTRSPECLSGYLRTVSVICKSQAWPGAVLTTQPSLSLAVSTFHFSRRRKSGTLPNAAV